MWKFAIELTRGDDENIIQTFDNKEEAMAFGEEYNASRPRNDGILCCVTTDFDEHGSRTTTTECVYQVWR